MTQLAGVTDSRDIVGMAEDIEDAIFDISPTETPFLTMARRTKATNTLHQWQTDALAAAAANRQLEGDEAAFTTATPTSLYANYTQISFKTVAVSRTANTVKKYGRAKELARLVTKYGRELKRDIENALVGNQGSSAGSNTVARSSAGFEAMIFTTAGGGNGINAHNTTGTTSAYAGGVFLAPTDGSATVTVTEAILTSGIQAAWTDGGNPSVIMLPYNQKARMAAFSGATKYAGSYMNQSAQKQAALVGAVDLYISDAGEHKLVLNRYVRTRSILGIDPEYVSVAFLDGIQMHDLAKTGDSEKKLLVTEFCLQLDSLDAHFQIKDLLV